MQNLGVLRNVLLKWSSMKNWLMFLLYLPWYNLFVILLQKMVVEFARSGIGLALEEMLELPKNNRIFKLVLMTV